MKYNSKYYKLLSSFKKYNKYIYCFHCSNEQNEECYLKHKNHKLNTCIDGPNCTHWNNMRPM